MGGRDRWLAPPTFGARRSLAAKTAGWSRGHRRRRAPAGPRGSGRHGPWPGQSGRRVDSAWRRDCFTSSNTHPSSVAPLRSRTDSRSSSERRRSSVCRCGGEDSSVNSISSFARPQPLGALPWRSAGLRAPGVRPNMTCLRRSAASQVPTAQQSIAEWPRHGSREQSGRSAALRQCLLFLWC
jgi:hypothetical protein